MKIESIDMVLHGNKADMGMLSAAQVDRYGNISTTCIGKYTAPRIRFGGGGGACDFGSLAPKTVIILEHDKRRFPEKVDFITTPGFLTVKNGREKSGLRPGTGPYAVVTSLGIFKFDKKGEMILTGYHPSTNVLAIKENVQWDLKVDDDVEPLLPPRKEELKALRLLDPDGMYLRNAKAFDGKTQIFV